MGNYFPVANRPIYVQPVAKCTGGKDAMEKDWGPKIVKKVDEICAKYPKDRGIIHTHNFAIAKRIEEIFFPGDPMPYYLSRTGEPLKVVCHIRDEAHRFGITFHRQKRSKAFIHSELENIEGVGPKTIELLLRHFRTVEKIRTAPAEELSALVGPAKAARLLVHFGRQ
jgi:excinuclease UvrABC nuclease subunit